MINSFKDSDPLIVGPPIRPHGVWSHLDERISVIGIKLVLGSERCLPPVQERPHMAATGNEIHPRAYVPVKIGLLADLKEPPGA